MKRIVVLIILLFTVGGVSANVNDYNASLKLLLHGNYTISSTLFDDSSGVGNVQTGVGGAVVNTTIYKLGNGSIYVDGFGDYVRTADSANWDLGQNWTIMAWVNLSSLPTSGNVKPITGQTEYDDGQWHVRLFNSGGNLKWNIRRYNLSPLIDISILSNNVNVSTNTWYQVVFQRNLTGFSIYQDGVQVGSTISNPTWGNSGSSRLVTGAYLGVSPIYFQGEIDELAIWNGAVIPIADLYPQSNEIGIIPVGSINASFTNLPNPVSAGNVVTLTDTSTGFPVTWNWSIAGVITNSTQNAAYKFTTPGTYPIWLNITNSTGAWSNVSQNQVVTNATEFIPLDLWMEGAYLTTWHITDSATGAPIPVVTITDSHSQQFDTTNGTGYLTEEFGSTTFYFASDGYTSRALTYFIDEDRTIAVQLTKAEPGGQQNVWYTPWQVRFRIVDYYSKPLPGTNVTAQYIAATLPSTDPSWLVSAFGISSDVAGDMLNSSVAMQGDTDDNGGLSFTMFKSLQYRLTITNTTSGVSSTKTIYPTDPEYVIYVRTTGQQAVNNTLTSVVSSSLPFYKLNTSYYNLSVIYQDATGQTTNVVFTVKDWTHGNTVVYTKNLGYPGTGIVTDNYTVYVPLGQEYIWNYNATKV